MKIESKSIEFIVPDELIPEFWKAVEKNKKEQEKAKKTNFSEMKLFSEPHDQKK